VYSFFHGYPEKGVWGIYAGVMPQVERRALELIQRMLALWQERPVSERRLGVLKRQFWGRQAILWERLSYRLQVQGRWLLDTGQPLEETAWKQEVLALSPADLQEAAQRYFTRQWIAALRPSSD
jgi:predicted Zn-dependent peptidase